MPIRLLIVIFYLKTSVNRSWSYCSFSLQYNSGAGTRDEPLRTCAWEATFSIARKKNFD